MSKRNCGQFKQKQERIGGLTLPKEMRVELEMDSDWAGLRGGLDKEYESRLVWGEWESGVYFDDRKDERAFPKDTGVSARFQGWRDRYVVAVKSKPVGPGYGHWLDEGMFERAFKMWLVPGDVELFVLIERAIDSTDPRAWACADAIMDEDVFMGLRIDAIQELKECVGILEPTAEEWEGAHALAEAWHRKRKEAA